MFTAFAGSMNIAGSLTINGSFRHNGGTIIFTNDTEKLVQSSNGTRTISFNNLTLQGGNAPVDLRFEIDVSMNGVLTIATIQAAALVDVNGVLDDHIFTLLSTDDEPTSDASIAALPSDATVSGTITVQRFLSGEGRIYRYLASPMQGPGAAVASWQRSFPITGNFANPSNPGRVCNKTVQPQNPSLFLYNEFTKQYDPYPASGSAESNQLDVGRGYAAYIRECFDSTLISVSGELQPGINRGTVSLPVSHTGDVTTFNNLVGNPYPSAIDWDFVQFTNLSSTIAIRDNGTGMFHYYSRGGSPFGDLPHGVIAQGQGFWVRSTGNNPKLIINENAKTSGISSSGNVFYRTLAPDALSITLNDRDNAVVDRAFIILLPSALSDQLDDSDVPKMNNQRDDPFEELPDLFTSTQNNIPLAINSISEASTDLLVNLVIRDLPSGDFSFKLSGTGQFSIAGVQVIDNYTNLVHDVAEGAIAFSINADSGSFSRHRFVIQFHTSLVTDVISNSDDLLIYPNPTNGKVDILTSEPLSLDVLNTDGSVVSKIICRASGSSCQESFDFGGLPSGIYFIRTTRTSRKKIARIVRN